MKKCWHWMTAFVIFGATAGAAQAQLLQRQQTTHDAIKYTTILTREGTGLKVDLFYEDRQGWPQKLKSQKEESLEIALQASRSLLSAAERGLYRNQLDLREIDESANLSQVWPTENTWSLEWEKRFAEWVKTETGPHFFVKYNLATDCADVAYSLRWIFSRIHHLPAANHLGANDRLLTNESSNTRWDRLPTHANWWEDRRFRRTLDYLLDNVYTHTLMDDSYPLAIAKESLIEGSYHLGLAGRSGHTQVIYATHYDSITEIPFLVMASTVPRAVRELTTGMLFAFSSKENVNALMRMRWAKKNPEGDFSLLAGSRHAWYSKQQFAPDFEQGYGSFMMAVYQRVNPEFRLSMAAAQTAADIESSVQERIQLVTDGYAVCQGERCAEGSAQYEEWSTPSRDKRNLERLEFISTLKGLASETSPQEAAEIGQIEIDLLAKSLILPGIGSSTVGRYLWGSKKNLAASNPNYSPRARWAINPEGVVEGFRQSLTGQLTKRQARVRTGRERCPTAAACPTESENYRAFNTAGEDSAMAKLIGVIEGEGSDLCTEQTVECREVQERAGSLTFSFGTDEVPFGKLSLRAVQMQSSPWLGPAQRWGQISLPIKYLFSSYEGLMDSEADWVADRWTNSVFNLRTQERRIFPGRQLHSLSRHWAAFFQTATASQSAAAIAVNLNTGEERVLPLQGIVGISISDEGGILVAQNSAVKSYSFADGEWQEVWTEEQVGILHWNPKSKVVILVRNDGTAAMARLANQSEFRFVVEATEAWRIWGEEKCAKNICAVTLFDFARDHSSRYLLNFTTRQAVRNDTIGSLALIDGKVFATSYLNESKQGSAHRVNADLTLGPALLTKVGLKKFSFNSNLLSWGEGETSPSTIGEWNGTAFVERVLPSVGGVVKATADLILVRAGYDLTVLHRPSLAKISSKMDVLEYKGRSFGVEYPSSESLLHEFVGGSFQHRFDGIQIGDASGDFALGLVRSRSAVFEF